MDYRFSLTPRLLLLACLSLLTLLVLSFLLGIQLGHRLTPAARSALPTAPSTLPPTAPSPATSVPPTSAAPASAAPSATPGGRP